MRTMTVPWWDRRFLRKYTSIYNNMSKHEDYRLKTTVWPDKTFQGYTKLNPICDYGKLSGDAFANRIIMFF